MADIAINPVVRRVQFTGNTGLGPFAFTFNILQNTDIIVYKNTTLLTLTTDYTVTINANGTGSVTLTGSGSGTALIVTDNLTIIGGRELSRTTDFVTAGDLLASSLNEQLDSNVIMSQQLDERFSRTISVSPGDADKTLTLPTVDDRKDKILKFDTEGNVEAAAASTVFANTVVGANFTNNVFTGDGSTVAFTTTVAAGSKNNCQVYIDGVYQEKASFSINATTLTFTEAPPLNASIEVIIGNAIETLDADSGNINYNQGGTGAQTRTVENKLQEFVSVKDFGATGDGVTDDTAAIQAAIDATSTAKQRLFVPAGTYISTTLNIKTNTYLFGVGTIKRKDSSTGFVLSASGVNNFTVRGIKIDANKTGATGSSFAVFAQSSCYQFRFDEITVINGKSHGIAIRDTADGTQNTHSYINKCTVDGCDQYGIEVQDCKSVTVSNNTVLNSVEDGIVIYGTSIAATDGITVESNYVENSGDSGILAPYIFPTNNFGVTRLQVLNNKVTASGENGIGIQVDGGVVSGNMSWSNGTTISHQGILVNGNYLTIDGNTSSANTGVGIDVGDGKFISVTDNIVFDNGIIGIEINSAESCVVDGNIVRNNFTNAASGVAASLKAGILIHKGSAFTGNSLDITISNNDVKVGTDQSYGISLLANTDRISIVNNSVSSSGNTRDINIEADNGSFICRDNITSTASDIASATTVTLDHNLRFAIISGTTGITSIVTDTAKYERGRKIDLLFTGSLTVTDGSNLVLNGNLSATNGTMLTLVSENGDWYEVSRSVN